MLKNKIGVGLAVLGLLFLGQGVARAEKLSSDDENFIIKAKLESKGEIDLGSIAQTNTDHKEVREVAEHLVDDHRKMDAELDDIVHRHGIVLGKEEEDSAVKEHDVLVGLHGHDFDVEWVNDQLHRHEELLDQYKHAEDHADNDKVKEYAKTYVETIRFHQHKLEDLKRKIEG